MVVAVCGAGAAGAGVAVGGATGLGVVTVMVGNWVWATTALEDTRASR